MVEQRPLLLIGGPLELDDTEAPDDFGTVRTFKDRNGCAHLYYVMRDFKLDRWVAKYQRPVKEIAR